MKLAKIERIIKCLIYEQRLINFRNMIHHIGLQVIKEDVENFYIDLLNFKISKTFLLPRKKSIDIFNVNESPTIVYGTCGDFELELFISKSNVEKTFSHLCLQTENFEEIMEKAKQKGYKVYVHKPNQTFFISDTNHNVFEIKNK